jgi:hypothetical protein
MKTFDEERKELLTWFREAMDEAKKKAPPFPGGRCGGTGSLLEREVQNEFSRKDLALHDKYGVVHPYKHNQ